MWIFNYERILQATISVIGVAIWAQINHGTGVVYLVARNMEIQH